MTASARMAEITAGTGIHRRDELKARGKGRLARGARDVDAAGLERLPQHFQHPSVPLRQLVEEKHTVMGERDLPRAWITASTDQSHRGCRVVRRAQRPPPPVLEPEASGQRVHGRRFERLLLDRKSTRL